MNGADVQWSLWMSEGARWAAVLAYQRWPSIPRRVFAAAWHESLQAILRSFPKALRWSADEKPYLEHCLRVFKGLMEKVVRPGGTPPTDVTPSKHALVAFSVIAFTYAQLLPFQQRLQKLDIPPDFDEEALKDTLAAYVLNAYGPPYGLIENVIGAVHTILKRGATLSGQPVMIGWLRPAMAQHASLSAFHSIGGLTPGLVREIVETGKVPKEAELAVKATPEEVRRLYHKMERCFKRGLLVDAFAKDLGENSTSDDLIEGLQGKWLSIMKYTLPFLWPPDRSTAHLLTLITRRDTGEGETLLAAGRTRWRHLKRDTREKKRVPFSLDEPVHVHSKGEADEIVSHHELTPDKRATIDVRESETSEEPLRDIQDYFRIPLSSRQRQVAELFRQGTPANVIADKFGVSPQYISNIRRELQKKMKPLSEILATRGSKVAQLSEAVSKARKKAKLQD